MSARRLTSSRLRLECLEGRHLPSGLVDAPVLARALDSHPAVEALIARYLAHDAASDNDSDASGATGAGFDVTNLVRAFRAASDSTPGDKLDSRAPDRGYLIDDGSEPLPVRLRSEPDLQQAEARLDGWVHDILASIASAAALAAPVAPSSPSVPTHIESDSDYSIRVAPAVAQGAAPAVRAAEEAHPAAVLSNAPDPVVHEYEPVRGESPACGAPPSCPTGDDLLALLPSAPSLEAIASSCRAALCAPLTGAPLAAALPADVHALDDAAQAFFEHLANLAPEWPPDSQEYGYVWLVAGVLLVGGGGHFVRRARNRAPAAVGRPPGAAGGGG